MTAFTVSIKKFDKHGDKTGWIYIEISSEIAERLKAGTKTSFRVKGTLDSYPIAGVALLPMGGGTFILALNAAMRRGLKKPIGATVQANLEWDPKQKPVPPEFIDCLADEPAALAQYNRLSKSHKGYITIWLTSVKSETARARRMAQAVTALAKGFDFAQMVRSVKKDHTDL